MRTARVFYLLLSVLQFIFFLKLVEYVRGEEISSANITKEVFNPDGETMDEDDSVGRVFIAPKIKRKKLNKPRKRPNVTETRVDEVLTPAKREEIERDVARLCPGCENNDCGSATPISAGFPVVPVIIAILVGIGWFIIFLVAWIFHTRPKETGGGYGGGYGSPQPGYGGEPEKPSIFDHFMKPHERSSQSYYQILHTVLDSISKLADTYNNSH